MKISRRQLNKIIRESLSLLKEEVNHSSVEECGGSLWLSTKVIEGILTSLDTVSLVDGESQEDRDKAIEAFKAMSIVCKEKDVPGLCFKDNDSLTGKEGLCPGSDILALPKVTGEVKGAYKAWLTTLYLMTQNWCEKCSGIWSGTAMVEFNKCKKQQIDMKKEVPPVVQKKDDPDPEWHLEDLGTPFDEETQKGGLYKNIPAGDPCFDGRPDSYVMAGRKSFGDWVYKLSKQNKKAKDQWGGKTFAPLAEKLNEKMIEENETELQMSMITDVEMEVYKVTKKGETGTEADAISKRVGYTFLLKDIKPRKSEEAASWDVHPLSIQVLEYLKSGGGTIDCPAGDAMDEGKLNRQQLREFISKTSGCGC